MALAHPVLAPQPLSDPLDAFLAALLCDAVAAPEGQIARSAQGGMRRPGFATILTTMAVGERSLTGALGALDSLETSVLSRAIARWTLAVPAMAPLRQGDALVADLFIARAPAAVLAAWLEGLRPAERMAAAAATEDDPLWAEDFERAAALWSGVGQDVQPAPGRESAAVLPWRWRRKRRLRRKGRAPRA
ncbi:MAG: hypothetical protein AAF577_12570 [Pseudomonadota bacterium]